MNINTINSLLASSFEQENSLGLSNGKMSGCIYFYVASRNQSNERYRKIAGKLLDDIFNGIGYIDSLDVRTGLAGIGIGLSYLANNKYVTGDINKVLGDLDDKIFKHLCDEKTYEINNNITVIQLLYYLYIRLTNLENIPEQKYLFEELTIHAINNIYEKTTSVFFYEPLSFNLDYKLPQFLLILEKISSLNFYNERIKKIMEELSFKILTIIPLLNSNRLYLLVAMKSIAKWFDINGWNKHMMFIEDKLELNTIYEQEFNYDNIYINNGYAGILLLLGKIMSLNNPIYIKHKENLIRIINTHEVVKFQEEPKYLDSHKGLFNGITGVIMAINKNI